MPPSWSARPGSSIAQYRYLIDFTYPLLSTTAIYLTFIFSSFVREQRQRVQIRGIFAQYMSPVLVEQLAQSPEKLVLGGEERELTIMFSDVRGFTTISESYKHDPQGLITLMNRFLTPLTDVIIEEKGYVDKYMGDAIMAFWNAPLDDAEHQVNACEAAIQMLEKIDVVNKEREQEAADGGHVYIPLNVGIGLNTGIGVVGNMGSDLKKNYSVLGDSVNLASRLEGQTKEYGFPIIVGSRTALAAKDKFAILELDFIMVKGKSEPEVIYAIAGREDVMHSAAFQRLRNITIEMLGCYRNRDWQGAQDAIERGRRSEDADTLEKLFKLYEARIKEFRDQSARGRVDGGVCAADEVGGEWVGPAGASHSVIASAAKHIQSVSAKRTLDCFAALAMTRSVEAFALNNSQGGQRRVAPCRPSFAYRGGGHASLCHGTLAASLHPDRRQILEPVLRLHELLHLRRQRVRVGVVDDPDQHGIVDDQRVRLRDQIVLLGGVERLLGLVDQRVHLRVLVAAPVDADRRDLVGGEEADDGVERIGGDIGDVVGGDAGVHLVGRALAPVRIERLELDHLEVDVDADLLEALLQKFVHRQRQHLAGAALRDDEGGLQRLCLGVAGLLDQLLGRGQIIFDARSSACRTTGSTGRPGPWRVLRGHSSGRRPRRG